MKNTKKENVKHTFPPVYDSNSEILILGSFPSVKSREQGFYYGHPQNRFWKVIAAILSCEEPTGIMYKKELLLNNHIAVWDVIESCYIMGSSDSSIENVKVNDFSTILSSTQVKKIYANGKMAGKLYRKYAEEQTGIEIIELPSSSPANAAYSLERLVQIWAKLLDIKK